MKPIKTCTTCGRVLTNRAKVLECTECRLDRLYKGIQSRRDERARMYLTTNLIGKRNVEIHRLRVSGSTYVDIGHKFGITTERARQIFMRIERLQGGRSL